MSEQPPATVVGCLLDASESMRQTLEPGHTNNIPTERLHAVLHTALKFAQTEQERDSNARVFVAAFGLRNATSSTVVDLCGVLEALLEGADIQRSGIDLLIGLANRNGVPHTAEYIQEKLTDNEARILYMYLQRHPARIQDFIQTIPTAASMKSYHSFNGKASSLLGNRLVGFAEHCVVRDPKAQKLAQKMRQEWWEELDPFVPRPVSHVVSLLQRLQAHLQPNAIHNDERPANSTLLHVLSPYLYGFTPMAAALQNSLAAFRKFPTAKQRLLVMISDGFSTDDNPMRYARELRKEDVTIATVYITSNTSGQTQQFYDRIGKGWNDGQKILFDIASTVSAMAHPIPVFTSKGWGIPSSGVCALYTQVSSARALDEFCSTLLAARVGLTSELLDLIGCVQLDTYINSGQGRVNENASNQGQSMTCYAHAMAAVLYMSLLRIIGRQAGYPSIADIRRKILKRFPAWPKGSTVDDVLMEVTSWYRPLQFRKLDEDGARQAVLRRRPVLTTFYLSEGGWKTFSRHFQDKTTRGTILSQSHMRADRSLFKKSTNNNVGHAVVLIKCDPDSLTFLNSWGQSWGDGGKFTISDAKVLRDVKFYDVYWTVDGLNETERQAYNTQVDGRFRIFTERYPDLLKFNISCLNCGGSSSIVDLNANLRQVECLFCRHSFTPEPASFLRAL